MSGNGMMNEPYAEEVLASRQRVAELEATTARLTLQMEIVQRRHDVLQALIDAIPDPVFVKDPHGTYVTINHAFARLVDKPTTDIIGKDDHALFPPEMARQLRAADQRILETGETLTLEEVGISTGTTRTYISTKSVRCDEQGHVIGLMGIAHDVTDLKRVEEAFAARAKQMEAVRAVSVEITRELDLTTLLGLIIQRAVELVDSAGAGVVLLWDEEAQQLVSQAWYGNLGKWIQHLRLSLGEGLTGIVAQRREGLLVNDYERSPYAANKLVPYIGPRAVLGEPLLYRDRLLGAITLGNEGTGQPFTEYDRELLSLFGAQAAIAIENAQLFRAVQEQATQLAQANEALREGEQRYRAFVSQSSEGIWRFEFEHPMPTTLPEDEQIAYFYHQSYLAECNDAMAQMYGYDTAAELVGVKPDALLLPSDPDNIAFLRDFIRSGYHLTDAESHEIDKDGHSKVFLNNLVGIIEDGQLLRTWGSQRDITERKRLEEGLLQTQKMAAIGTLAGGIAHDFNNILAAILGFTELALFDSPQDSTQQRNLHEVLTAGKRAKDLILQILTFSRQTPPHRQPIQLQTLVKEALIMLRASLPTTIDIQSHLDSQVDAVMADPTQIHQVLMNLCANTEHAMRETGGLLEVRLTQMHLLPTASAVHPDLRPGAYARLEVRDTGHGIKPELLGRIFEPFFTTKDVGQGSGMGLAVAHGIVASHGGAITVRSTLGAGTTFVVYLPQIVHKNDDRTRDS